ncbi:MAG: glycosyltransferase [Nitrosopumilus sp.]|nr:glycosyltransferase [Nitrosopumilus sp.]
MEASSKDIVSVIIPSFNHGHFLSDAIVSVKQQTYPYTEIIVIDDGSSDNTKEVAQSFADVVYVFQHNQGLSAARNKGLSVSTGNFLVFLDADDLLLPDALQTNLWHLKQDESAGMVAGAFMIVYTSTSKEKLVTREHYNFDYKNLLFKNLIGVPGSAMHPRWVFNSFIFDIELTNCEEWDLYLKISRRHKILYHPTPVVKYRKHGTNKSSNLPVMLESGLTVLKNQRKELKNKSEFKIYRKAIRRWKNSYTAKIYFQLIKGVINKEMIPILKNKLLKYNKWLFIKFRLKSLLKNLSITNYNYSSNKK